jgi:micrococcal nuclease
LRAPTRALALLALSVSCAAGGGAAPGSPGGPSGVPALVTRVVDGDTIHVEFEGRERTIRLIGIDTPEVHAPGEPVGCFGPKSTAFVERSLSGRAVRLEFDVERTDRYGRTLAYVWIGGELFNEVLVREGYAVVTTYPPNVRYVERFTAAQRDARRSGRGLWSACPLPSGPP